MILDTSATVATVTNEPDQSRFRQAMLGAESLSISSVTVLETRIVLQSRQGAEAVSAFNDLLANAGIITVAFDAEIAEMAFQAFRRYGKGQRHPAQLNIIDCAAYALAKIRGERLFQGRRFREDGYRAGALKRCWRFANAPRDDGPPVVSNS
jgi:ribonuclease VapC